MQAPKVIAISGLLAAGKTGVATSLGRALGASVVSTRSLLEARAGSVDRGALIEKGRALENATDGAWIESEVVAAFDQGAHKVVVDAVRTPAQLARLRERYRGGLVHLHVVAPDSVRVSRFANRPGESAATFTEWTASAGDPQVSELRHDADVVVDTDRSTEAQVLARVARRFGIQPRDMERCVDVLVGGQWGSEGKGNIAGYLAPEYGLLVRTGGPNSGHTVMRADGQSVTHYHLPSGTSTSESDLLIGPGSQIRVDELLFELDRARVGPERLSIDPNASVITDEMQAFETGLVAAIGSTGSGVGWATAERIRERGKFGAPLAGSVKELERYIRPAGEVLDSAYRAGAKIFLEGTQGAGLSLWHGPYPHVTSRDTTASTFLAEAGIPPLRTRRVIMVVRSYPIRVADPEDANGLVGTSGPMYAEIDWDEVAARSGLDAASLKAQEHTSRTKRLRRVGEFDWESLVSAARLNGPTDIAATFVDQIDSKNARAHRFDQLTPTTIEYLDDLQSAVGAAVSLVSTRFHTRNIIDRRDW